MDEHLGVLRDIGASALLQQTGQIHVYPDAKARGKDGFGWAQRKLHGVEMHELGRSDIVALEPAVGPHYQTGYYLPEQGLIVDPLRYAKAIAAALGAQGVTFIRDKAVGIDVRDGAVCAVLGARQRHAARHAVVCAGAWSAQLLRGLEPPIPLETQRGYHAMLPRRTVALQRVVVAADRKLFASPIGEGLRLAGTVEFAGLRRPPTPARAQLLVEHGKLLFPDQDMAGASVWMGHRPCLPDSLPVIGPALRTRGLWLNFGHGHLGLTMAPISGRLLAASMTGGEAPPLALGPYGPQRFR